MISNAASSKGSYSFEIWTEFWTPRENQMCFVYREENEVRSKGRILDDSAPLRSGQMLRVNADYVPSLAFANKALEVCIVLLIYGDVFVAVGKPRDIKLLEFVYLQYRDKTYTYVI